MRRPLIAVGVATGLSALLGALVRPGGRPMALDGHYLLGALVMALLVMALLVTAVFEAGYRLRRGA